MGKLITIFYLLSEKTKIHFSKVLFPLTNNLLNSIDLITYLFNFINNFNQFFILSLKFDKLFYHKS